MHAVSPVFNKLADGLQTVKKEAEEKFDSLSQAFRFQRKELQDMKRDTNQSLFRLEKDSNTGLKTVRAESEQRVQELQQQLQKQSNVFHIKTMCVLNNVYIIQ